MKPVQMTFLNCASVFCLPVHWQTSFNRVNGFDYTMTEFVSKISGNRDTHKLKLCSNIWCSGPGLVKTPVQVLAVHPYERPRLALLRHGSHQPIRSQGWGFGSSSWNTAEQMDTKMRAHTHLQMTYRHHLIFVFSIYSIQYIQYKEAIRG